MCSKELSIEETKKVFAGNNFQSLLGFVNCIEVARKDLSSMHISLPDKLTPSSNINTIVCNGLSVGNVESKQIPLD